MAHFEWKPSETQWFLVPDPGERIPCSPPPVGHVSAWYAGKLGGPNQITFCSRCGLAEPFVAPCEPVDLPTKRIRMESAIHTAQLMNDVHAGFRALGNRPPATGPAYQNVSAVVRNVVGGWNRR